MYFINPNKLLDLKVKFKRFNKKNIFFIFSVLIVLLFFLVFSYFYSQKSRPSVSEMSKEEKIARELKLQEQVGGLIKTKDFQKCDEVKDEMYKTVCINNIALNLAQEKKDISYCKKLDDKLIKIDGCEMGIISGKAVEKKDPEICKELGSEELRTVCVNRFNRLVNFKKESK